jgi:hypothetical protein
MRAENRNCFVSLEFLCRQNLVQRVQPCDCCVCTTFTEESHHNSVDGESLTAPSWALGGVPGKIARPALEGGLFRLCGEHGSYFGAANSLAKLHGD